MGRLNNKVIIPDCVGYMCTQCPFYTKKKYIFKAHIFKKCRINNLFRNSKCLDLESAILKPEIPVEYLGAVTKYGTSI